MIMLLAAGCRQTATGTAPVTAQPTVSALQTVATLPPPIISSATTASGTEPLAAPDRSVSGEGSTSYSPIVLAHFVACPNSAANGQAPSSPAPVAVTGELKKWHTTTLNVSGPDAAETDDEPNPFLDYRLQVGFLGPSGQYYDVPGYYAGDGQGNGAGNVWQARFTPDEAGSWRYCVSFRAGDEVAVKLEPDAGQPLYPDGATGEFLVADRDPAAPGFLKWGRLEYVGKHYLRFRDGPYWIKGGTNSPENFLGYAGFDNTFDQGGIINDFLHAYAPHVGDWREGDPDFVAAERNTDGRGIIGALNYLGEQHVNSIHFLPLNLGGDGRDTYPFLSPDGTPYADTRYDISKLHQWATVLEHAQRNGIALHVTLNETEQANREWLDGGALAVERKLFYREMIARFGHLLAIKWDLSEENVFSRDEVLQFADSIRGLDWAAHPIAIHNPAGWMVPYEQLVGERRLPAMAVQYEGHQAGALVEQWREISAAAGQPWVIDMDENNPAGVGLGPDNAGQLRKTILYDVYFSGGNLEWYAGYYELPPGGDVNLEDFRTREAMWRYMWYARRFMEENLPFWDMTPADDLLSGEAEAFGGGEVLAYEDRIFAIYLPAATPGGVLRAPAGAYRLRWYDPRTGEFAGDPVPIAAASEGLPLGAPPHTPDGDWVALITALPEPGPLASPAAYP